MRRPLGVTLEWLVTAPERPWSAGERGGMNSRETGRDRRENAR